jgi:hypothetical protein
MAEQKEPVVAFDEPQHFVGSRTKPRVSAEAPHKRIGNPHTDTRLEPLVCDIGEEEESEVRVVLIGKRSERFFEPWTRLVNDDDRNDWRGLW